ncbi:hypothetical protein BGZ65_009965 [Modicella reniformis]|uniref:Uncharacterized protein n=1 Tax=Modicella reniformis TaxID=1440133 RepID=A0A9P6II80_9FUNG|nr:hypothetical protein BGZ65_009965 [Modicella reniformis]
MTDQQRSFIENKNATNEYNYSKPKHSGVSGYARERSDSITSSEARGSYDNRSHYSRTNNDSGNGSGHHRDRDWNHDSDQYKRRRDDNEGDDRSRKHINAFGSGGGEKLRKEGSAAAGRNHNYRANEDDYGRHGGAMAMAMATKKKIMKKARLNDGMYPPAAGDADVGVSVIVEDPMIAGEDEDAEEETEEGNSDTRIEIVQMEMNTTNKVGVIIERMEMETLKTLWTQMKMAATITGTADGHHEDVVVAAVVAVEDRTGDRTTTTGSEMEGVRSSTDHDILWEHVYNNHGNR